MNGFETIKAAVPMREAAEHYGLRVLPNGTACCPFHEDHHPSLKLNEDYFFCFGCGAHGDVIDFTARLWGLSAQEAVEKLRGDFGIETGQMPIFLRRQTAFILPMEPCFWTADSQRDGRKLFVTGCPSPTTQMPRSLSVGSGFWMICCTRRTFRHSKSLLATA